MHVPECQLYDDDEDGFASFKCFVGKDSSCESCSDYKIIIHKISPLRNADNLYQSVLCFLIGFCWF